MLQDAAEKGRGSSAATTKDTRGANPDAGGDASDARGDKADARRDKADTSGDKADTRGGEADARSAKADKEAALREAVLRSLRSRRAADAEGGVLPFPSFL